MDDFYFDFDKYEFWKIYDAIKSFYPIGIKKDEGGLYHSYPGLKVLQDIIEDNIHDEKNYEERWVSFTKELEKDLGKEMVGTTYGQAPSFSGYVLLNTATLENLTRTKELHFSVSLVGPFYTVIGQDVNSVVLGNQDIYNTTNYLVVSPEVEFAEAFQFICNKIEERFKGFRFVPFWIYQKKINGLEVRYSGESFPTIYNALFNEHVNVAIPREIGDGYYKSEDWIRDGYVDEGGGWTAYPPEVI